MKFVITSEHIALERAKLEAREKELKAERERLEEFEREAARLASSYEVVAPDVTEVRDLAKSTKRSKAAPPTRVPTPERNRVYTPGQIETLRTASIEDVPQLAKEWGRTIDGVERKREELRAAAQRKASEDSIAESAQEDPVSQPHRATFQKAASDTDRAEAGEISETAVETTSHAYEIERSGGGAVAATAEEERVAGFDNPSIHEWGGRLRPRPGIPVKGLIDNGRHDQRVLDPVGFSSKNEG